MKKKTGYATRVDFPEITKALLGIKTPKKAKFIKALKEKDIPGGIGYSPMSYKFKFTTALNPGQPVPKEFDREERGAYTSLYVKKLDERFRFVVDALGLEGGQKIAVDVLLNQALAGILSELQEGTR